MNIKKITNFFFEIASLRRIVRGHGQVIPGVTENIGDHSFRVTIIGMILAKMENCDENKVLKMCLFHDVVEARIGDANFIHQQYVKADESLAREDQMDNLPIGKEVLEYLQEMEALETIESIVAKDADILDQLLLEQENLYRDEKNRNIRQTLTLSRLKTESAIVLAKQIRETNPFERLYKLAEEKTGYKV